MQNVKNRINYKITHNDTATKFITQPVNLTGL